MKKSEERSNYIAMIATTIAIVFMLIAEMFDLPPPWFIWVYWVLIPFIYMIAKRLAK